MHQKRPGIREASLAVLGLLLLSGSNASAQACLGISGRNTHLLNIAGGVVAAPNSMNYRVRGGISGDKAFGGLRLESFERTGQVSLSALAINADLGAPRTFGTTGAWTACPMAEWNYLSGNAADRDKDFAFTRSIVSVGAAVGRETYVNDRVVLLPFASGSWIKRWSKEVYRAYDPRDDKFFADNYFALSAGTGVQLDRKFVVNAFTRRAVGISGRFEYGVSVAYLFSRKPQLDPFRRTRSIGTTRNALVTQ